MSEWREAGLRESARQDALEEQWRKWDEEDAEAGKIIAADSAVCDRLGGMHLSSAHARPVVEAARSGDVHATAEALRAELFVEQRLLQAAIDIVREVAS